MMVNVAEEGRGDDDYLAFISYRHADNREGDRNWATWLHSQLEAYEVPAELISVTNSRGESISDRIYPIFRDELSLPADASLADSIARALECSRFMIVLCSPRAVESRYVNEEIIRFKKIGRGNRIIAAIIDGEPNSAEECFPEALRYELDDNGQLDFSRPTEPVAADFRLDNGSQGYTNPGAYRRELVQSGIPSKEAVRQSEAYEESLNIARLKIISGILGVSLERITERDKVHQLAKAKMAAKRFRRIAAVMATLTVCAVVAGLYAFSQFQRAESTLADLRSNLGFMNVDLRMLLTSYVPSEQRRVVIEQVDRVVESLQDHGSNEDDDQRQFAAALKHKADELKPSEPDKALELYMQALDIQRRMVIDSQTANKEQHDLSVTLVEVGDFYLDRSELDLAMDHYQEATRIRRQLVEWEPHNERWQRELAVSRNRESIVLQKRGKYEDALTELQASLETAKKAFKVDPNNAQAIRDVYIAWNLIGNTYQEAGDLTAALEAFSNGIDINLTAYERDPQNLNLKRELSVSYTNLGDVLIVLDTPEEAIKHYQQGMMHSQELLAVQPNHPILITDLAGNHMGLGHALEETDPSASLEHFHNALKLVDIVISTGQLDDDRRAFPDIINNAIARLEAKGTKL